MVIRRRSFVKGVVASAALPFIPKMPAITGGIRLAHATSRAWATHFPVDTYLQNNGGIAGMPSSATTGLITLDWKVSNTTPGQVGLQIDINNNPQSDRMLQYRLTYNSMAFFLLGANGRTETTATATLSPLTLGSYYNFVIAWNSASNLIKFLINGTNITPTINNYNGPPEGVVFTGASRISVDGDIADIGILAGGAFVDPVSIVAQVYDGETGYAERNASNGSGILPDNRLFQVWLSGPASMFPRNRAAGTWTVFPSDTENAYNDTSPTSSFTVVGNPLTDAATDPFQP